MVVRMEYPDKGSEEFEQCQDGHIRGYAENPAVIKLIARIHVFGIQFWRASESRFSNGKGFAGDPDMDHHRAASPIEGAEADSPIAHCSIHWYA